eukprot:7324333-Pyramimonas_sp.AAC.1
MVLKVGSYNKACAELGAKLQTLKLTREYYGIQVDDTLEKDYTKPCDGMQLTCKECVLAALLV